MSFNGSGTFVINSAGQPVVANTVISATTFNALTSDLANGLSTCITKDGQTTPTANIPMGGFKITNLATGTAASDAATVAQIQSNGAALVTVTGTDTLTGTLTPALVAYVTGAVYYFVAPATNTGAVTLNIDTLGAKNVTRDGTTALVAGDIVSGEMVAVVYDGTRFQLISPVNSFTNLNVSGTLTVAGATTLNGNLQVGNAAADTVNFQASGWTLTNNVSVTGTWADIGTITTADINGGTIDGTTIGGGTAAAGTFTTVGATTGNITTVNATTVDATNLEVTNLKAKDGTAAGSIADSTGVVTLNSVVATTADINGGTIDATTIGGSSPAVGNFTTVSAASAVFTTATITTVNTTTLDLTNLEVTNIKAKDGTASMTIDDATGKVNVTTVSAASMNAAVAAITTGSVANLTATAASVASMNAGVALLTTATVTTLNASGASIASANIGNLQFTAASIASINAGVAVINNLTATSASVASANVGVALITTGTVTNLTATGASVASANVGTAVITGLTVTGASIASVNAGTATLSGNLTLNGGTANGVLYLNGSKVATSGSALVFDSVNLDIGVGGYYGTLNVKRYSTSPYSTITMTDPADAANEVGIYLRSTGTNPVGLSSAGAPIAFYLGGPGTTEGMRLTSTGLGIGTSSPSYPLQVRRAGGAGSLGVSIDSVGSTDRTVQYFSIQDDAAGVGAGHAFYYRAASSTTDTLGFMLDEGGNVGIGTSSPSAKLSVSSGNIFVDNANGSVIVRNADTTNQQQIRLRMSGTDGILDTTRAAGTATNLIFGTEGVERARIDSNGNLGIGTSSPDGPLQVSFADAETSQFNAGAAVAYLTNTNTTNNNWAQIFWTDSDGGAAAAAFGAQYTDHTNDYAALSFSTRGTSGLGERARITSGGYGKFSNDGTYTNSAGSYHEFRQSSQTEEGMILRTTNASYSGNSLLVAADRNTTNNSFYAFGYYNFAASAYKLRIADSGDVTNTNGTYGTISDAKMKTDIVDAGSQWADIKGLRFRKFKMKDDPAGLTQLGVVAQEVEQVSPGLVDEHTDRDAEGNDLGTTTKSVKTSVLLMKAAVALQEAMARIEKLEAEVAALKGV
jgi:hypothetical protein